MESESFSDPASYFPCAHCKQQPHYISSARVCSVERYYNTFVLKRTSGDTSPNNLRRNSDKNPNNTSKNSDKNIARVYPTMASLPDHGQGTAVCIDHVTGKVRRVKSGTVVERYQGREVEFILKIQVPWTLFFGPDMTGDLMAYDESRDFTVTIRGTDKECGKIREKILKDGYKCVNPGMKLFFKAKLHENFSLDVYLDQTSFQKW